MKGEGESRGEGLGHFAICLDLITRGGGGSRCTGNSMSNEHRPNRYKMTRASGSRSDLCSSGTPSSGGKKAKFARYFPEFEKRVLHVTIGSPSE